MPAAHEELDLLRQAKTFDLDALGVIYDIYSPGVYRYACRLLGDMMLAEDCVSETFTRFLNALHSGKGPKAHLQAYLYRIAHNWVTDLYRQKNFIQDGLDEEAADGHPTAAANAVDIYQVYDTEKIRQALFKLTDEQRFVTTLHILEEMSNEEIAGLMQKPVGAVKALQHRALVKLKSLLDEKERGDE